MAVGDECWVPRDPNWTPFGRAFDKMMEQFPDLKDAPPVKLPPIRKIGVIVPVSQEQLDASQFDFMDAIKRAPARRCQALAMETYWDVMPEWDNECIERGSE
jgi:hypothetical protein